MNIEFMVLVAAPLSVYLLILLYSLQDIEPSDAPAPQKTVPASEPWPTLDALQAAHPLFAAPVAQTQTTAEAVSEASAPVAGAAAFTQDLSTPPSPPSLSITDEIEPPRTIETHETVKAEPLIAPDDAEQSPTALVVDSASVPPPEPELAATDEIIITEPGSVAPTENSDDVVTPDEDLPDAPLQFPEKGSPKFVFDYRGRLWVEKKNRGFFKQLRRPQLPPDEPH